MTGTYFTIVIKEKEKYYENRISHFVYIICFLGDYVVSVRLLVFRILIALIVSDRTLRIKNFAEKCL